MSGKSEHVVPSAFCSPPSHPTTLGDVWIGETKPSQLVLELALKKPAPVLDPTSDKPRNVENL